MKGLNELIEKGSDEFEGEELPSGHKERFLSKLEQSKALNNRIATSNNYKRTILYLAAASILAFLVISPIYFRSGESLECPDGLADYKTLLKERSADISLMADKLDPNEKGMVMNTLNELINETVPFESQLPSEMDENEKSQLKQQYYCPKIQGVERLGKYIAQLLHN
ncbi:MAG: hypothetical protein AB9922_00695 [Bacteroidales bacterium]